MDIRQKEIQRLKEIKRKKDLTKEDLEFLYNIHYHIVDNDTYNEARSLVLKRDKLEDLSVIFDCPKDKIGFNEYELKEGKEFKYFESQFSLQHIKIKGYAELEVITFPEYMNGSIELCNIEGIIYKQFPKSIKGEVILRDTKYMESVNLPEKISYSLKMRKLEQCRDVKFPKNIYGSLNINSLKSLDGIIVPEGFEYSNISGNYNVNDFKEKVKQRVR